MNDFTSFEHRSNCTYHPPPPHAKKIETRISLIIKKSQHMHCNTHSVGDKDDCPHFLTLFLLLRRIIKENSSKIMHLGRFCVV